MVPTFGQAPVPLRQLSPVVPPRPRSPFEIPGKISQSPRGTSGYLTPASFPPIPRPQVVEASRDFSFVGRHPTLVASWALFAFCVSLVAIGPALWSYVVFGGGKGLTVASTLLLEGKTVDLGTNGTLIAPRLTGLHGEIGLTTTSSHMLLRSSSEIDVTGKLSISGDVYVNEPSTIYATRVAAPDGMTLTLSSSNGGRVAIAGDIDFSEAEIVARGVK